MDANAITDRYHALLDAWNRRRGDDFAAQFTDDGEVVGFDGSRYVGAAAIAAAMNAVFAGHETARYVAAVRSVRPLGRDAAVLSAGAAMVARWPIRAVQGRRLPSGHDHPAAARTVLFATLWTPAGDLHVGTTHLAWRPEESERLTAELRALLD